jgi:ubiquinone/menaquinone biosynthesis C-methylase UbiE
MDADAVKAYYNQPGVVADYTQAVSRVGLWRSEEKIFTRLFKPEDTLLELGCGTGRIAIGLWELGYRHILGLDIARDMVEEARRINQALEYGLSFRVGDATKLAFSDGEFDGAIFGFNGLMTIPRRENRRQALREIRRVAKPGAWFAFTTHNRATEKFHDFWVEEEQRWKEGKQAPGLDEFGDRILESPRGPLFIHIPIRGEIMEDLQATGWRYEVDALRAEIANEKEDVRAFGDDCRFWIAQNPGA